MIVIIIDWLIEIVYNKPVKDHFKFFWLCKNYLKYGSPTLQLAKLNCQ